MRVRIDAGLDAEHDISLFARLSRQTVQGVQLGEVVHNDAGNPCIERHLQLFHCFVIAVHIDPADRKARLQSGI